MFVLLLNIQWVTAVDQTAFIMASLHQETPLFVVSDGSSLETQQPYGGFVFCADSVSNGVWECFKVIAENQDCVHLEDDGLMVRVCNKPNWGGCNPPAVLLEVRIDS